MKLTIRPMTKAEQLYCYSQSGQIRSQTGNIGYLRADMDSNGQGFFSSWNDFRSDLETQDFKDEFNALINELRFSEGKESFLKNRTSLGNYCFSHPEAAIGPDMREFGFRADTDRYAYMMRLNPNRGEYNLYCYCYQKEWLDRHLKEAERGIRFIDSSYRELFRLQDGGKIRITWPDGEKEEKRCRYIDSTHLEVGSGPLNIYHICEFAERMEGGNARIEPVEGLMQKEKQRAYER